MKLNMKKTVVGVSVALALSVATVPAQAGVMNIMDDAGGQMMVLGAAGVAVGFLPGAAFVGIGACMHWHCISAYGGGDDGFAPVPLASLSDSEQSSLIGLMEHYSRTTCGPTGARGGLWSRLNDHDYDLLKKDAKALVVKDNKLAEQYKDVSYFAPAKGASLKVDPDEVDGISVHGYMAGARASSAHMGVSCLHDTQRGAMNVKSADVAAEVWVNKNGKVYVRTLDLTANKNIFSHTHEISWLDINNIVSGLVQEDKVKGF
jgi:hypothetical protein